ncbi:uncharacterized protein LOC114456543 isoform X1 [Gouania willdenowi]|uniref:uncharacterized protein LOC114456543 isoform X1 n=1 Tax=Gouania willdenowi TaxID=441366 RepID=UPI001054CE40|nr:uncharacterized protein LOC114456543 isoform X1 [Gouania willdenowi]XP_028294185.1 uncharacterized protein LOC114456543 isoform X1 [Gouania willdenowi]XP_028294186.1 uncharacterized protein LOC114456543 isoform X1 [Gouania willdenowi]XP_028294187.1 uncharacterized protein LOC114456543 isoform X1 [Gouania willdenowi]XP_028294188.1 uncharacterized protein LOC114456543 isoform X1 [Gouania willdenowi]XP_028294189.1 uncharacterized protein LOC114456543 isoform X1 [Gouania willdenowi]XP_02829419
MERSGKGWSSRMIGCGFIPLRVPEWWWVECPQQTAFFRSCLFFWRPVGVWGYSLRCPRMDCPAQGDSKAFLYRCGYSKTVRHICEMSGWYSMLTEVLACNECRKAAKESATLSIGRFLAWDAAILKQLSPAHQAMFPAVLTRMRGVDKQIIRLMRDRTVGNTMAKVWRQVQESHCEDYLHRKDLYTTLLSQLNKPGGIIRTLSHQFQHPPTRRELPSPQLLRKAFLISEVENIEDYRTQIMSTFGKVLKYDSTRKSKDCGLQHFLHQQIPREQEQGARPDTAEHKEGDNERDNITHNEPANTL